MSRLPQWWNDEIAAAWNRARDAAMIDWKARGDRLPIEPWILEHALAFGHGARSAYPRCETWDAVRGHLRDDWARLGNVDAASWDQVSRFVHHEWLRAAGPGGDASPVMTSA
jgi:hypothetical protein